MLNFTQKKKIIIGMVHLQPLPGTPYYKENSFNQIYDQAIESAMALYEGGADGCLVQTVDRVYNVEDYSDPARTVSLGLIVKGISDATGNKFHIGVHLLKNAIKASLAVSKVSGGSFIRASALIGTTFSEFGIIKAKPLEIFEYRKKIHADDIKIIADVDSRHYQWFGDGRSTWEVAKSAKSVGADAISLENKDEQKILPLINTVRVNIPDIPIVLSGNTTFENASRLLKLADGAFVGTCLQKGGWSGQVDITRVRKYMDIVRSL